MADQEVLGKIAKLLRRSPLVRRGLEYHAPVSTVDTALSHLHQLRRLCVYPTPHSTNLTFGLELHQFEHDESTDEVKHLDPIFSGYANESEMVYKRHGRVKFFQKNGDAWWPERYALHPTFGPEDVKSAEAATKRLQLLEKKRDHKPRQIIVSWNCAMEALKGTQRVDDTTDHPRFAHLYQAGKDAEGKTVLWIASLPQLSDQQRPDKQGRLKLSHDQGGVLVQLTEPFLAALLYLLWDAGAAEDGLNFADSYYVSAPAPTRESLTERIRQLEDDLTAAREQLAKCGEGANDPPED